MLDAMDKVDQAVMTKGGKYNKKTINDALTHIKEGTQPEVEVTAEGTAQEGDAEPETQAQAEARQAAETEKAAFEGTEVEVGGPTQAVEGEQAGLEATIEEESEVQSIVNASPADLASLTDAQFEAIAAQQGPEAVKTLRAKREQGQKAAASAAEAVAAVEAAKTRKEAASKVVVATKGKRKPATKRTPGKKVTLPKRVEARMEAAREQPKPGSKEWNDISDQHIANSAMVSQRSIELPHADDVMMNRAVTEEWLRDSALMFDNELQASEVFDIMMERLHADDPLRGVLAQMNAVGAFDGHLPVHFRSAEDFVDMGVADPRTNGIAQRWDSPYSDETSRGVYLKDDTLGTGEGARVLVHEFVHFATIAGLETDPAFRNRINQLLHMARQAAEEMENKPYGLTNNKEFLAEGLTNPEFQKFLNGVQSESPAAGSLWQRLVDAIARFIGMDVVDSSVLADVLRATSENLQSYNQAFIRDIEKFGGTQTEIDIRDNKLLRDAAKSGYVSESELRSAVEIMKEFEARGGRPTILTKLDGIVDSVSNLGRTANRAREALSSLDQVIRRHTGKFVRDGVDHLKQYEKAIRDKIKYAREQQKKAETIARRWRSFEQAHPEQAQILSELMIDSTLEEIHPDKTYHHSDNKHIAAKKNTAEWKARVQERNDQYKAIGPAGRKLFQEVKKYHEMQRKHRRSYTIDHILKANGWGLEKLQADLEAIKGHTKADRINRSEVREFIAAAEELIDAESMSDLSAGDPIFDKLGEEGTSLKETIGEVLNKTSLRGPYFPLRRFGDYAVEARKDYPVEEFDSRNKAWEAQRKWKAGDPTRKSTVAKNPDTGKWELVRSDRIFSTQESPRKAKQLAEQLKAEGYTDVTGGNNIEVTVKQDLLNGVGPGGNKVLSRAIDKMDERAEKEGGKLDPTIRRMLEESFVDLMLDSSIHQSERKRKKVSGATYDMRRAFSERAFAGSWANADMLTAFEHDRALRGMERAARDPENPGDKLAMGDAVRELKLRDQKSMQDRRVSAIDSFFSKTGFFMYLTSPSYAMVNATQPSLVAAPYLLAKYGARASAELFNAYRVVGSTGAQEIASIANPREWGTWASGERAEGVLDKVVANMTPEEQSMMQRLFDMGIIDATFAQELYKGAAGKDRNWSDNALDFARTAPAIVEIINRAVVAKAAYNLEMRRSDDVKKAVSSAADAVLQTQFDYSDMNKPRWFKMFPGARSIMMFKMYAQGMYALMGGSFIKAVSGKGGYQGGRAEAAKTFGLLTLSHTLAAGAVGGLMEPFKWAINAVLWALGDEDDPERWRNSDDMIRDLAAQAAGKEIGEVISKGLPRAVGVDLSSRLGINNLAFMDTMDQRSYQDWFSAKVLSLLGPVAGMFTNAARAVDYADDGQWYKALEATSPKLLKDAMRAYRVASSGITDFNGKVVAQPDTFDKWMLAFAGTSGFASSEVVEAYDVRNRKKSARNRKADKARQLRNQWLRADPNQRMRFYRDEIMPYNRRHPEDFIKISSLFKSLTRRKLEEAATRGGYFTDDRQIEKLRRSYNY